MQHIWTTFPVAAADDSSNWQLEGQALAPAALVEAAICPSCPSIWLNWYNEVKQWLTVFVRRLARQERAQIQADLDNSFCRQTQGGSTGK